MMWGTGEGMGWWMIFGTFWMILFWGLIIWFFVRVFERDRGDGRSERGREDRARAIARERYARGEITQEEFEQLMRRLDTT